MLCVKCGREVPDAPYCGQCGWRQASPVVKHTKRGNGQGRVFKRDDSWYAQVTLYSRAELVDGKKQYKQKRRTKGGFRTKKDALAYLEALRLPSARKMPTLLDLYEVWKESDLPNLSESKQASYKKARERLESIIGCKIDVLTTSDLQRVVNDNAGSYYTARDMKVLLSHLYKRALADQFVTVNLAQFITLPALEEKDAEPFTQEEVQKIWEAFAGGEVFAGYLLLMIYSGMMPGELFACRKDMIDFERCEIYGCGKKTKKRKKEVPIVFPEFIRPVIEVLCAWKDGDRLQPQHRTEWYDAYHKLLQKIGVRDLPPYSCRHTTGTETARLNLSAPVIQNIMRHAKITTTQRYIHLGAEEAHKGINSMKKVN